MLQFEVHVVTAIAIAFHQTVIISIRSAQSVLCLIGTAADAQIVTHRDVVITEHLVLPIVTSLVLVQIEVIESTIALFEVADTRSSLQSLTLVQIHHILVRIHGVKCLADGLTLDVHVVANLGLTALSTLGCNQDNTVSTLRTVDSC